MSQQINVGYYVLQSADNNADHSHTRVTFANQLETRDTSYMNLNNIQFTIALLQFIINIFMVPREISSVRQTQSIGGRMGLNLGDNGRAQL